MCHSSYSGTWRRKEIIRRRWHFVHGPSLGCTLPVTQHLTLKVRKHISLRGFSIVSCLTAVWSSHIYGAKWLRDSSRFRKNRIVSAVHKGLHSLHSHGFLEELIVAATEVGLPQPLIKLRRGVGCSGQKLTCVCSSNGVKAS